MTTKADIALDNLRNLLIRNRTKLLKSKKYKEEFRILNPHLTKKAISVHINRSIEDYSKKISKELWN